MLMRYCDEFGTGTRPSIRASDVGKSAFQAEDELVSERPPTCLAVTDGTTDVFASYGIDSYNFELEIEIHHWHMRKPHTVPDHTFGNRFRSCCIGVTGADEDELSTDGAATSSRIASNVRSSE